MRHFSHSFTVVIIND